MAPPNGLIWGSSKLGVYVDFECRLHFLRVGYGQTYDPKTSVFAAFVGLLPLAWITPFPVISQPSPDSTQLNPSPSLTHSHPSPGQAWTPPPPAPKPPGWEESGS